jgi:hypothetical protein
MTELLAKSSIGVESSGNDINWSYLNEDRIDDPVITALVKEAQSLYIDKKPDIESIKVSDPIDIYIENFNTFLKSKDLKFSFTLQKTVIKTEVNVNGKKEKVKKLSSKEKTLLEIKENNIKKNIDIFLTNLVISNNVPISSKCQITSFFLMVYWAIFIYRNKKKDIDLSIYLDCSISLYRAIQDSEYFLTEEIKSESLQLLEKIEKIIKSSKEGPELFKFIKSNLKLISDSYWDKNKPKAIALYPEQKEILELVSSNLDTKKLIFFEMPPANGKTILSAILAKVISHKNKENLKINPFYKKKTLLYICYNSIVRNEVAKICVTHNIDLKYWLAITKMDKEDSKIKTFLRPYKNCYPDWNRKGLRSKKEQEAYDASKINRFSSNIRDQWEFFLEETRPVSNQHIKLSDYENAENLPEIIISDLDSAYALLKEFPNTFVPYFDETFASAELNITSKIMSVLGLTVFLSATLAKPSEIPTVVSHFKERHGHTDDSFLHIVKSNKQHISCTFINEDGFIYAPHNKLTNFEEISEFLTILDEPIVKRSYSPEVVFNMSLEIDKNMIDELKYNTVFRYFGMLSHESLRDYACDILRYIGENDRRDLFDKLISIKIKKMPNMDVKSIFTQSACKYQSGKTLHVATSDNFNKHVEYISLPFLKDSPKISNVIEEYEKKCSSIKNRIESIKKTTKEKSSKDKSNKDKSNDTAMEIEYQVNEMNKELDNTKLSWPSEYILNSKAHASNFGTSKFITNPNNDVFGKIEDLDILDDTKAKLYLSGIGVYQPENFSVGDMNLFLRNKDNFRFILSTPSIVYGTNISLSIIDIDSSFLRDSTRNTLYQLIGRAGRKGRSHSATIIFRNNDILNMVFNKQEINIEASYIENNYKKILSE